VSGDVGSGERPISKGTTRAGRRRQRRLRNVQDKAPATVSKDLNTRFWPMNALQFGIMSVLNTNTYSHHCNSGYCAAKNSLINLFPIKPFPNGA
jgi:hypothetical protein